MMTGSCSPAWYVRLGPLDWSCEQALGSLLLMVKATASLCGQPRSLFPG